MSIHNSNASRGPRIATVIALILVLIYVSGLAALYGRTNGWLVDASGLPRTNEYMGMRAAGDLALLGRAVDAYDWQLHEAAMATIAGRTGMAYFPFSYPPIALLFLAVLALVPYLISAAVWISTTCTLYLWSAVRIAGLNRAAVWALATPAAAINTFVAHTGFATAAVTGVAIEAIPKRPILAGVLIGLLSMKPQLGVLIPVALIAGGHWRVIGSAIATVVGLVLLSLLSFGVEPWLTFAGQMAAIQEAARFGHPRIGETNYTVLVSVYGALRAIGAEDALAMGVQVIASLVAAVGVFRLWLSTAPFPLKAAGLMSASLLATPYLFIYDLLHLTIAVAFLVRHTGLTGLQRNEVSTIMCAGVLIALPMVAPLPTGFVANAFIGMLMCARAWPYMRQATT